MSAGSKELLVAGVDEAGRGPLAGPVVAAAVILHPGRHIEGLADSKKLSEKRREALYELIQRDALAFCIAEASVEEIDRLNILQATLLAMQRAVAGLVVAPTEVLIDGNVVPRLDVAARAIVQGDALEPAISAASILAKVHRDRLCLTLDQLHPAYGFRQHKGYGTAAHLKAISDNGPSAAHRMSFEPMASARVQAKLF